MAMVSKLKESISLILLLLLMAGVAVWLLNPMDPIHGITAEEIDRIELLKGSEAVVELSAAEQAELVPLLSEMRLWGVPTTSLENIDGLLSQMFRLVLRSGRELEVAAGGGYYILNGVGYRLGYDYELGEAINSLYTELFEQYTGRWPYG